MTSLDVLINRATDGTLTDDNWQYILDVCDFISGDPEQNSKEAMKIIRTRLSTRDANVLFRTLSLVVAIAENCGSRMQQEIASTQFLQEYFLKKLSDKKIHKHVKIRIAEVIINLNSTFKNDPSLRPIQEAHRTLMSKFGNFCKAAPSKPAKTAISGKDKEHEEQELERALQLSVQEYEREQSTRNKQATTYVSSDDMNVSSKSSRERDEPEAMTIANVKKVCALYDLISYEADELSFRKGDTITVIESVYRDWWRGSLPNGQTGIFPLNYVTPVVSKSAEEAARETSLEERLVRVEHLKIDELIALLSSEPSQVNEDRVTELYNDVLPTRPSLAKAIDKYGGRRDELGALHDRMNEATNFYNVLIDRVVSYRGDIRLNGNLPYPSGSGYPELSVQQQPTGSGFGNQRMGHF